MGKNIIDDALVRKIARGKVNDLDFIILGLYP